jgi:hypothetical protein
MIIYLHIFTINLTSSCGGYQANALEHHQLRPDRGHGSAGQTLGKKVMGSPVTTLDEEIAARVKVQEQEQHQQ